MKKIEDFFGMIKIVFYISAFGTLVLKGNVRDVCSVILVVSSLLCVCGFAVYAIQMHKEDKMEKEKNRAEATTSYTTTK